MVLLRRLSAVFLLAISGCAPFAAPSPAYRFSEAVRQLGLTPVYPPREDFAVGDVYIVAEYPGRKLQSAQTFVGRVEPLRIWAREALGEAVAFDRTTFEGQEAKPGTDDLLPGTLPRRADLGGSESIKTLPLVAFPSMTLDAGSSASLGLLRPLQALGLFASRRTTVTLDFNDTRSYGVSPIGREASIQTGVKHLLLASGGCGSALQFVRKQASSLNPGRTEVPDGAFIVVTRVYVTRKINYTYRNAEILALAERAVAAQSSGTAPTGAFSNATIIVNGSGAAGTQPSVSDTLTELNRSLSSLPADGTQFVGINGLGLTLSRDFVRPVAVAYEAIRYAPSEAGCVFGAEIAIP